MSQTPDFKNFASVYRSPKRVIDLAPQGERAERDELATISDSRPLTYHTNYHALSTARFRRAGLLVTADTCCIAYTITSG